MSFGDAYIEKAVREPHHTVHRSSRRHCRRYSGDFRPCLRQHGKSLAEHILPQKLRPVSFQPLAGHGIELAGSVPYRRILLGRRETISLLRMHVQDTRPLHLLDVAKHFDHFSHVVAVERPEVSYVQPVEYVLLTRYGRLQRVAEAQHYSLLALVDKSMVSAEIVGMVTEPVISSGGGDFREIIVQGADIVVYRHVVVV